MTGHFEVQTQTNGKVTSEEEDGLLCLFRAVDEECRIEWILVRGNGCVGALNGILRFKFLSRKYWVETSYMRTILNDEFGKKRYYAGYMTARREKIDGKWKLIKKSMTYLRSKESSRE